MIMWLDDVRIPWQHGYINAEWCKTAAEAIALLQTGKVTFASLDHDLSTEHYPWSGTPIEQCEGTGYDVVCWLEANPEFWPPEGCRVHSMNPVGRQRMLVPIQAFYGRDFQL